MTTLIITEKPSAALKIATALSDKKLEKKVISKVSYYELEHNKEKIIVVCAVGHLYTVTEKDKKAWTYPIFNVEWKPTYLVSKGASFTKPYLDLIKKVVTKADNFIVACDWDVEGEVIGYNILKYICKKEDAKRMQYSTTTTEDLLKSYENIAKHIDKNLVESGLTRHELDYFYGINLSRALTLSIKHATNMFKIMSSGRVQGPALYILYKREKEIQAFKPEPFWELSIKGLLDKKEIEATHKSNPFQEKKKADSILASTKGKKAIVSKISKHEFKQEPLTPFDLTSLQIEAYKTLGFSPSVTLQIAQALYTNSYISYPRTSSQKLPESIDYKKILTALSKQFPKETSSLLKKKLKPTEGKKTDPAHPAIYPTGELPKNIEDREYALYELIVRRFFVCFGDPATRETVSYEINCNNELFSLSGTVTKEPGWHTLYGRFAKFKDEELPLAKEKDELKNAKVIIYDKETQPPRRYNEASLVKELEKQNLGTKATRSEVVSTLFDRNYVKDKQIQVTNLGFKVVETLEKYCPEILDENLTRQFEEEMEDIKDGKYKKEKVLDEAQKALTKIFDKFKKNELNIGKALAEATVETRTEENTLGLCPLCKKGNLMIKKGKFGYFAACSDYPECKITLKLPSGLIKNTKKICDKCNYPVIMVIRRGRRPQELCINPECESKKIEDAVLSKEISDLETGVVKKTCPKCGSNLIVRTSFYGKFLACPGYPKCKYIESIGKKEKK
ncbi:MAG: DNA topoisomerase I [Candidatus Nanoarchaeia archaeon]|nr:DNA topoisomerase I [Candidatus Nanoarchaeia archaeon]